VARCCLKKSGTENAAGFSYVGGLNAVPPNICKGELIMANIRLFDPAFDDMFDPFFKRFMQPIAMSGQNGAEALQIKIDVAENDGSYTVHADLPGVKKEDINVRIDGNMVQIDASTRQEKDAKDAGGRVLRSERYYGSVSRTFSLAQDVDNEKAEAKFENGVLTLQLPKRQSRQSQKLAIQ
jgi:HSP20 family protein